MNSFGRLFKVEIFGESHGKVIGALIDGCPPGIDIKVEDFIPDLNRRKPGAKGTSFRIEDDVPLIKSGVYNDKTTGSPILIIFENKNIKSTDYNFNGFHRPGQADFVASKKFKGFNNPLGSGHFSGRLTLGIVAAGIVAKKIIPEIKFSSKILLAGGTTEYEVLIEKIQSEGDSIGGVIECRINNVPIGLGEPFFDSVESVISHIIFSIPGAKAIEFGEGLKSAYARGSEFNDVFVDKNGKTKTNNAGGINGGITNGNEIVLRVWFKPASSILKKQTTYNFISNEISDFEIIGRHDACYVLRAPVIVENAVAIALADLFLIQKSIL
ncbi:MAG: chorismate synthase [Bacteroidales bacterium]|jgi:chorismate synthase